MLNSTLLKAATKVANSRDPAQFTVLAQFISEASGSKFSFYPIFIDSLRITRNYADNFADEIDLQMTVSPKDYALMQDQGQDLLCILTITYVDFHGKQVFTPAPRRIQYNAMINNPQDVRKAIPDIQEYTEPSLSLSVRLIEPTVYKLRQTKVNTVFQTVTVGQAIHCVTESFGITKLHLIEPDNSHVYDHISVGSYQGISSVYGYLQSSCGVYTKGINAYITDGCLYVYPPFETDPTYDKSLLCYQVDTGRFEGVESYHSVSDKTVSLLVNTQPQSYDLSIAGSENVGTGFIFNRASRMTDGFTAIDSKQGAQFTDQPSLSVTLANPRTAIKGKNNLAHVPSTDNPYPYMSELAYHQASLMEVQWPKADPFQLDPCHRVIYYYDYNETMVSKTGILEKAHYAFTRQQRSGDKFLFSCAGTLTLRLSPNTTKSADD